MSSERLLERLSSTWNKTQDKKNKSHALVLALISSIKWPMVAALFPRLCLTGLRFCQPLLLKRIVDFVGQPDSDVKTSIGYGLIGATALVYLGNGVRDLVLWFLLNADNSCLGRQSSVQLQKGAGHDTGTRCFNIDHIVKNSHSIGSCSSCKGL